MYEDKVYTLLSPKGDPAFHLKLKKELKKRLPSILNLSEDSEIFEYLTTFEISALNSLLGYWYETGKKMDIEKLIELISSLIATGILGYTQNLFQDYVYTALTQTPS